MGMGPVEKASGFELAYNLSEDTSIIFSREVAPEQLAKITFVAELNRSKHQQRIQDSFREADGLFRETLGNEFATYFTSEEFVSELKLLGSSKLTVAIVHGEYETLIKLQYLENLPGIMPWRKKVHIIPDSAHCTIFENPDPVALLIHEFVTDVSNR